MILEIYVALLSVVTTVLVLKEMSMPEKFWKKPPQDPVCAKAFESVRQEIAGLEKLIGEQTEQIEKLREEIKNRQKLTDGEIAEMEERLVMRIELDEEDAPEPEGKKKSVEKAGVGGVEVFTSRKAQFAASQSDPTVWQKRIAKDKPAPAEPAPTEQPA